VVGGRIVEEAEPEATRPCPAPMIVGRPELR